MIQYVLPEYELPGEYKEVMNSIDHHLIVPATCVDSNALDAADVIVFNSIQEVRVNDLKRDTIYSLRIPKEDLFENEEVLIDVFGKVARLSITITNIETFTESDFKKYDAILSAFAKEIEKLNVEGKDAQLNLLTDRIFLKRMNNCGAGDTNITLAPDGKFYICPAFYQADSKTILSDTYSVGSLEDGLDIKNKQLYKLDFAPLCKKCDAYQCRRCVWLNRKTTLEVNTPSHEQCVIAHIERNNSREISEYFRSNGDLEISAIKEIDYLDPFDNFNK